MSIENEMQKLQFIGEFCLNQPQDIKDIMDDIIAYRTKKPDIAFTDLLQYAIARFKRKLVIHKNGDPLYMPKVKSSNPQLDTSMWVKFKRMSRFDEQVILILKYVIHQSDQDIAQTLGLTVGSVRSRLHRSLIKLAAHVDNH